MLAALPSHALYKIVAPDGKVTYSDVPPPAGAGRATLLSGSNLQVDESAAADSSLPLSLRQISTRFPVTLFASADCTPCDSGRRLLLERGIPFSERAILTEEDAEALNRLTGARTVPALSVGAQALRGYSELDWHAYLDAAGYPRESKLPRNFSAPAPTPLVERKPTPRPGARAAPAAAAEAAAPVPPPAAAPGGIRF
jgi:glutaredoxin